MKKFVLFVVVALMSVTESYGTLWTYSGDGRIADKNGGLHGLSVVMVISDMPRYYSEYDPVSGTQGSVIPLPTDQSPQLYYQIASFQMDVAGTQSFAGNGHIFGSVDPISSGGSIFTDEWQLSADVGGETHGLYMDATFPHYDSDGSDWLFRSPDAEHYGNIGPIIDMGRFIWFEQDGLMGSMFGTFNQISLRISRDSNGIPEAPIPEPATLILVATGLLGVTHWRSRKRAAGR